MLLKIGAVLSKIVSVKTLTLIKIAGHYLQFVRSFRYCLHIDVSVKGFHLLQLFQKLAQLAQIQFLQQVRTELQGQTDSQSNNPQSAQMHDDLPGILDHLNRKTVDEAGYEPLEHPHRHIHQQFLEKMKIELPVESF